MTSVFILGGDNQTYLEYQVDQIQRHVANLRNVVYVNGPWCDKPPCVDIPYLALPKSRVHWSGRRTRISQMQQAICESFANGDMALILHGDCIPIMRFDLERPAWLPAVGGPWLFASHEGTANLLTIQDCGSEEWTVGGFRMQFCFPSFLHLDDLESDSIETTERKLAAVKQWDETTILV